MFRKIPVYLQAFPKHGGIAQLARASALQAEGRRFDSDYLHFEKRLCRTLQGRFLFISINYENLR